MDVASMEAQQQQVHVYVVVTESRSVLKVTESQAEAEIFRDAYEESCRQVKRRAQVKKACVLV